MYRSKTFSENLNFKESSWNLPLIHSVVGYFLSEFLQGSVLFSYGPILVENVSQNYYSLKDGLWAVVLLIFSLNFSGFLARFISNKINYRTNLEFRIAIGSITVIAICLLYVSVYFQSKVHIILYGLVSGLFSSIVSTIFTKIVKSTVSLKSLDKIRQISRCLSFATTPYFMVFLIEKYGIQEAQLLMYSICYNTIPASLLIFINFNALSMDIRKLKAPIPAIELIDVNNFNNEFPQELNFQSNELLDKYNNLENSYENDFIEEVTPLAWQHVTSLGGITILPQILEENEDNISSENSSMTYQFYASTNHQASVKTSFSKKVWKNCCNPYKRYIWKRRYRRWNDLIIENFLIPFKNAFRNYWFYPCLLAKITQELMIILIALAAIYSKELNMSFLIVIIAVSWMASLLVTIPLFNKSSIRSMRFRMGMEFLVATTYFLISYGEVHNMIIQCALLFGFGFGVTSYFDTNFYRNSIKKWTNFETPLELLTATTIILIYLLTYILEPQVFTLIVLSCIFLFLNLILWTLPPIFKHILNYFRGRCCMKSHSFL